MTGIVVHRAPVVLPVAGPALRDGAIVVSDGLIMAVGGFADVRAIAGEAEVVEWTGAIIPGLVNAHTHLQYSDMAEVGRGSYEGFEDWSRHFIEAYVREHDWRASAAVGATQSMRSGTTTVADVVTDPAAAGALHDAGLYGIAFWEVFNRTAAHWVAGGRAEALDELARIPAPPGAGLSPHALYSLDTEVLRDLADLARAHGVRQHIHAAEAASENDYAISGTGVLADQWRGNGHGELALLSGGGSGLSAVAYLDSLGSLGSTTHLAHGIYTDADDRALLRARRTAVALCPRSNAVIGLDPPPVAAYLAEGNAIAVGTDSLSSSPSLNVLEDVAALFRIARAQGYHSADLGERLLEAATRGGARALGLADGPAPTGSLAPGHRADFAVLAVDGADPDDALAELVETGTPIVTATHVAGEPLWLDPARDPRETIDA